MKKLRLTEVKSLAWGHTVREWQRSGFEPRSFCATLPEGCGRPAPALSACLELPLPSSIPVGAPSPTLSPKLHPAGLWGPTLTHNVFLLGISIFITWRPQRDLSYFERRREENNRSGEKRDGGDSGKCVVVWEERSGSGEGWRKERDTVHSGAEQ